MVFTNFSVKIAILNCTVIRYRLIMYFTLVMRIA